MLSKTKEIANILINKYGLVRDHANSIWRDEYFDIPDSKQKHVFGNIMVLSYNLNQKKWLLYFAERCFYDIEHKLIRFHNWICIENCNLKMCEEHILTLMKEYEASCKEAKMALITKKKDAIISASKEFEI